MSTAKLDVLERVSFLSSATTQKQLQAGGGVASSSTPEDDLEPGAQLRSGGPPQLLSRESFGLLAQYAAVGLVYGTLPATIYPFLTGYLNMEGTATTSATALLSIPWSLKVFIGMLSDNVPIFGYRRRPYMMLGWAMAATCLGLMAMLPMPAPYFVKPEYRNYAPALYAAKGVQVREDAPTHGARYIVLMMLASLGYLLSDVAADAVVVEYAQREPAAIRGRTQTAIYTVRTLFSIVASCLLAFGMNGPEYGGDFQTGLSFATVMLLLAVVCVPVIPLTWLFVHEDKYTRPEFAVYLTSLWDALQSRAFYQVIAYNFFSGVLANISYVASYPIQAYWVKATNLSYNLSNIVGNAVMVATLVATGKYGLHWNWRQIIAVSMLCVVALDAVCSMLVTWNVVRSQWFWLGVPIVEQVPASMSFLVSTFVVVELAGHGNEGACYGLLTTVVNLSSPFALTLTKSIDGHFDVWNKDILSDTTHVRTHVTYTILISYACKLVSLAFLGLLPPQKAEAQALKRDGGSSRTLGMVTVAYCVFALCWSIVTNLLAIFEST